VAAGDHAGQRSDGPVAQPGRRDAASRLGQQLLQPWAQPLPQLTDVLPAGQLAAIVGDPERHPQVLRQPGQIPRLARNLHPADAA
jgi:hypothetical protein